MDDPRRFEDRVSGIRCRAPTSALDRTAASGVRWRPWACASVRKVGCQLGCQSFDGPTEPWRYQIASVGSETATRIRWAPTSTAEYYGLPTAFPYGIVFGIADPIRLTTAQLPSATDGGVDSLASVSGWIPSDRSVRSPGL